MYEPQLPNVHIALNGFVTWTMLVIVAMAFLIVCLIKVVLLIMYRLTKDYEMRQQDNEIKRQVEALTKSLEADDELIARFRARFDELRLKLAQAPINERSELIYHARVELFRWLNILEGDALPPNSPHRERLVDYYEAIKSTFSFNAQGGDL
jgi:hypothetical protein